MIDKDRWKKISEIIDAMLKRPARDHPALLEQACAGDDALRREVEALLECHWEAESLMTSPALDVMARTIAAESASLTGSHLGPYRVEERIGSGGMGDVYRGTDTRLRRPVALKILPPHLSGDAYLRRRFDEEAQAVAAVRHPHICVLHDIGQEGEIGYLVMEYLEGETLAVRLTRGPLPPSDAFRYAVEIADALAATHESGITHRDLKPANIMLTSSGAKLLDFGLATLQDAMASPDGEGEAPIAGTLPYMAPEQLQQDKVDRRTDIFAFGALLYEIAVGRQAFDGESRADVTAAILRAAPEPMPATVPPSLRALEPLIRRCLARNPAHRWQDTREMADQIRRLASGVALTEIPPTIVHRRGMAAVVLVAVLAALSGIAVWRADLTDGIESSGEQSQVTFAAAPLHVGNMRLLTAEGRLEIDPAISPDGRFVAYSAGDVYDMRIFVRPIAGGEALALAPDVAAGQFQPRWSADGQQILFVTTDGVFVASPSGGGTRPVELPSDLVADSARVPSVRVFGAAWSPDSQEVAVAHGSSLTILPIHGGARTRLTARSWDELHHCDWSPDRAWIACVSGNWFLAGPRGAFGNVAPSAIVLIATSGGERVEVANQNVQNLSPTWSPDSRRLYFVSNRQGIGDVYSVEVPRDGRVLREPTRVTTGLGAQSIAFSADRKRLIYSAYSARANLWSMPIPSRGVVDISAAMPLTSGDQIIEMIEASPDGEWLLYDSTLHGSADIFRMPTDGGPPERLTTDPSHEFAPTVSPDGRLLAYHSFRTGTRDVFVQPLDGGPVEQVTSTASQESYPVWMPDSRTLLFFDQSVINGRFRGMFLSRRPAAGTWEPPSELDFVPVRGPTVFGDGRLAYMRAGSVEVSTLDRAIQQVLYRPMPQSADPVIEFVQAEPGDMRTLYLKSHDAEGRASLWSLPLSGGTPTLLVRFDDLSRPSSRFEFAVAKGRFFFAIDDRRSNIWLADVTER